MRRHFDGLPARRPRPDRLIVFWLTRGGVGFGGEGFGGAGLEDLWRATTSGSRRSRQRLPRGSAGGDLTCRRLTNA